MGSLILQSRFVFVAAFLFYAASLSAQPGVEWQKCYGGSIRDFARAIEQTNDGGYIIAGYSHSTDGDVTGGHGDYDYWVVKISAAGLIQWQKSFGGSLCEMAYAIAETSDRGYVVAGSTTSNDGDVTVNHGNQDLWIVKFDCAGAMQWQKSFGGSNSDFAYDVEQTADLGYIVAGVCGSNDGDVVGNNGGSDYWILKLDTLGTLQWQRSLGGSLSDGAYAIEQTSDGGYIVTGSAYSSDGFVSANHGIDDFWTVKLDSVGGIEWEQVSGGSGQDRATSVYQTDDGGFVVAGRTESNDVDVSGNHGGSDYWVVKYDDSGIMQWQKCYGGSDDDVATSVQQTTDNGYIIAGYTDSSDGEVIGGNHGGNDYWVIKTDSLGLLNWQKCLGGSQDENAFGIQQTSDGGYIVAGFAGSNDGDVMGHHGLPFQDYWVVKLAGVVGVGKSTNGSSIRLYPNPVREEIAAMIDPDLIGSSFSLYASNGALVKTGFLKSKYTIIGLNELASGTYIFVIGDALFQQIVIIRE